MEDTNIAAAPEHLFPIKTAALRLDVVTGFDLYLPPRPGRVPVVYRKAHLPFDEEAKERLESNGVILLYVSSAQRPAYQQYLEATLGEVLADPTVPLEKRSERLYESAQGLVREVFEEPRSGKVRERSGTIVSHMTKFLFAESQSFNHLMKVTSFDYYTYTHSVNVFVFSTALAQDLGHAEAEVVHFGQGALLHDIGKSLVSLETLNCKGKLNDAQWEEMKQHPVYGYDVLREQGETDPVILDVVRHHHEKLNGKGYPGALGPDEISHWVRISTIAGIFDALTTRRSYKDALDTFPTLQFMKQKMADELDMDIFRTFVMLMGKEQA